MKPKKPTEAEILHAQVLRLTKQVEMLIETVKEAQYVHYRMAWPKGHREDPGPPAHMRDYVKRRESVNVEGGKQ